MLEIELIYDRDCPNTDIAKTNLTQALSRLNISQPIVEWQKNDPHAPDYVQNYGSPTLLINGEDVLKLDTNSNSKSCRLYPDSNGNLQGAPDCDTIIKAIHRANSRTGLLNPLPVTVTILLTLYIIYQGISGGSYHSIFPLTAGFLGFLSLSLPRIPVRPKGCAGGILLILSLLVLMLG